MQSEGSTLDPDAPWNHIMLLAVRSSDARRWWTEQFKDDATKVILRIKNVSTLVEGDAPIAASVVEHASTPYVPQPPQKQPRQPQGPGKPQPKPPQGPGKSKAPWEKPQKRNTDVTGKHKICHGFSNGKCTEVAAGQCGPNSCAAKPMFIHACCLCGEVGHNGKSCTTRGTGRHTPGTDNKRKRPRG